MPELPEMETYRQWMIDTIVGKPVQMVDIQREKSLNMPAFQFTELVVNQSITTVTRRAKHLVLHLQAEQVLLLHLMLGGRLFYGSSGNELERAAQVILHFSDGMSLSCIDLRLGYLHLLSQAELLQQFDKLGPEPLTPTFGGEELHARCERRKGPLKGILVNQEIVAGLGNVYSDESAFVAGIRPDRKVNGLSDGEWDALGTSIKEVLVQAIDQGGYMDPYMEGDMRTGHYQYKVRYRKGEPCYRCGTVIETMQVSSKTAYFCPYCQK